jgi:DNA-binding response OmpR family regulator
MRRLGVTVDVVRAVDHAIATGVYPDMTFAQRPGQVFTRNQLMDLVWRYSFYTDTSTVTVHVRRLRAKIEPDPARPRFLETVWGVGYRFAP